MTAAATPLARAAGFEVTLPLKTKNPNNNAQGTTRGAMFGRAAKRAKERAMAKLAVGAYVNLCGGAAALLPVEVTLTRVAPSNGLDEHDALGPAMKGVIDGVADALGLKNDRTPLVTWKLDQRRGAKGVYQVVVRVMPRGAR